ncbi:MAG TPA: PTS sugar transporter subunit IIA [Candidatus Kapabacteria bacterium]|nr:PTS sugar transporter subunit IIA [Candidatus Kapabacteria bacterium]
MSYLSELLPLEQIQLKIEATDKTGVLRELIALVPEIRSEKAQQESFLAALLERERMHTTAIGDGIALPHARNPLAGVLKRPLLIFGRHVSGVPFGALDNKPVRLLFLLASPNLTDHLTMLARLSRVLRDQNLRSALLGTPFPAEIIKQIAEAETRTMK